MTWGNEPDNNYEDYQQSNRRRRNFRDRWGKSDDDWGEAYAGDLSDDGSSYDLSYEDHAGGLNRDYQYEQSFEQRQAPYTHPETGAYYPNQNQGNLPPTPPYQGYGQPPLPPHQANLPTAAQQLQDRMNRTIRDPYQNAEPNKGRSSDGFDALFDSKMRIPGCGLPAIVVVLGGIIAFLGCSIMAVLAFNALTRLLGI